MESRQSRKLHGCALAASFAPPILQSELVFTLPGTVSAVSAVKPNLICRCVRQRGVSRNSCGRQSVSAQSMLRCLGLSMDYYDLQINFAKVSKQSTVYNTMPNIVIEMTPYVHLFVMNVNKRSVRCHAVSAQLQQIRTVY